MSTSAVRAVAMRPASTPNTSATMTGAFRRDFPWARVPGYWAAQVAGAVIAAGLLRGMSGTVGHVGVTVPHGSAVRSLMMEALLTWLLVTVILGPLRGHKLATTRRSGRAGSGRTGGGRVGRRTARWGPTARSGMPPRDSDLPAPRGETW